MGDFYGWDGSPLGWGAIALRLGCTVAAAALIGFNRQRAGHAAGLRTLGLVGLAAALAMLQANLLLPAHGKTPSSFSVLDLMRFPLGILTGIGFIGAGAIVRRGDVVVGLTTAAALWLMTVLGLCFGGGQIGLGWIGTGLGVLFLQAAVKFERRLREERRAILRLTASLAGPGDEEIRARLTAAGFQIVKWAVTYRRPADEKEVECRLRWRGYAAEVLPPPLWQELLNDPRLCRLQWLAEKGDQ